MATSADLGKALEVFVTKFVATGRYHSKIEVLHEGVRLVQEREARLAALDASIARGVADADAGRVKSTSEVLDRLEAIPTRFNPYSGSNRLTACIRPTLPPEITSARGRP